MLRYLRFNALWFFIALSFIITASGQQLKEISIISDKPGAEIQPTMWGVFFEDINFAAEPLSVNVLIIDFKNR
jgi:hypothetical protein